MVVRPRAASLPLRAYAARLAIIGLIFLLALLAELRGGTPYSERELGALWGLVIAGFGLTLLYTALLKYRGGWGLPRLEVVGDGLLITLLLYCTGGADSLFGFLFVLWIVHAAIRSGPRVALATAAAAVLVFVGVCLGPVQGWLLPFESGAQSSAEQALRAVGTHTLAFVGVGFLAHHLAREMQARRQELFGLGELHQRIMDNVPSGLLTATLSGQISSFNREAVRITGRSVSEILGTPLRGLFPELPPITTESRGELCFVTQENDERQLGYSRSALRDDRGAEEGSVLIFQDLTHVKAMEEQLHRSERLSAVGQLAAGLAHEIRNPLASLSGAIELLAADLPAADANSRRLLRIVRRETERLDRLVGDFLTYAGPGPKRIEPVVLRDLFEELRQLLIRGEHGAVELALELAPNLRAQGDPDQLRQVFWNLLLNAAEADGPQARITVEGECLAQAEDDAGAFVEIRVRDRGAGIPAEHLERIFEPFFTTRPKGTGLGLATVHRIVEAHGGRLQVRSARGEGTCIHVVLPRAPSP